MSRREDNAFLLMEAEDRRVRAKELGNKRKEWREGRQVCTLCGKKSGVKGSIVGCLCDDPHGYPEIIEEHIEGEGVPYYVLRCKICETTWEASNTDSLGLGGNSCLRCPYCLLVDGGGRSERARCRTENPRAAYQLMFSCPWYLRLCRFCSAPSWKVTQHPGAAECEVCNEGIPRSIGAMIARGMCSNRNWDAKKAASRMASSEAIFECACGALVRGLKGSKDCGCGIHGKYSEMDTKAKRFWKKATNFFNNRQVLCGCGRFGAIEPYWVIQEKRCSFECGFPPSSHRVAYPIMLSTYMEDGNHPFLEAMTGLSLSQWMECRDRWKKNEPLFRRFCEVTGGS